MAFGLNFQTDSESDSGSEHNIYQNDETNSVKTPVPKKENLKLTDRTERNKTFIQSEQHLKEQNEQIMSKKTKSKTLKSIKTLDPEA